MRFSPGYERVIRACGTKANVAALPPRGWRQNHLPAERLNDLYFVIGLRSVVLPTRFQA